MSAAPLKIEVIRTQARKPKLPRSLTISAARQARLQAVAARRSSLKVPSPFATAADFLSHVRDLASSINGSQRQIADQVAVSTSTVSKWLSGRKVPLQPNLDKIIEWWKANRDKPHPNPHFSSTPSLISLSRLPVELSARLRRAATLRNVDPLTYASQILDRHLPDLGSMQ